MNYYRYLKGDEQAGCGKTLRTLQILIDRDATCKFLVDIALFRFVKQVVIQSRT